MLTASQLINNPALLKLDLYCRGARLNEDSTNVESAGGRKVLRTRAGLGSGLELILPKELWTNVPVVEEFTVNSPYDIGLVDPSGSSDAVRIRYHDVEVAIARLSPRPGWYGKKTSTGRSMTSIGTLQGTYLGIYPGTVCQFWTRAKKENCKFCSVGLNLGMDDANEKTLDDILEVVQTARAESKITYVDLNAGHAEDESYLDMLEPIVARIKRETGLLVGLQAPPHSDLSRYDRLRALGLNRVSFCFELFDRECFERVCPGKANTYGLDRYLRAIEYCAKLGSKGPISEPWVTNGEMIAGLEPPDATIAGIDWLVERGAVPTICVFRPLRGTDYENVPPPTVEELAPVFKHLFEACARKRLPIGLAPNVHVSLVMLPEEARFLSEDKSLRRAYAFWRTPRAAAARALLWAKARAVSA
ncbi:MAG: radical SAM protein [Planctomycetes bacterium]|nr:radical SAM protein [Planctomycetota bacterium]